MDENPNSAPQLQQPDRLSEVQTLAENLRKNLTPQEWEMLLSHGPWDRLSPPTWMHIMSNAPDGAIQWEAQRRGMIMPGSQSAGANMAEPVASESRVEQEPDVFVKAERLPFGEKLARAYDGYSMLVGDINTDRLRYEGDEEEPDPIDPVDKETFARKFTEWATKKQEYLSILHQQQDAAYTLLCVPNDDTLRPVDVVAAAEGIAQRQDQESTGVDQGAILDSDIEDLAGRQDERGGVRFSIIMDAELYEPASAKGHRRKLMQDKWQQPDLKVPTVLEALANINIKAIEAGGTLSGGAAFATTVVNHFDTSERKVAGKREKQTLVTYVDMQGIVHIEGRSIEEPWPAKMSIG